MKRSIFILAVAMLFAANSASAFTIKDGEGNKVKISPLGIKVTTKEGDKVKIGSTGVDVTSSSGDKVKIGSTGINVTSDSDNKVSINTTVVDTATAQGETNTKTGILLADEHQIVVEARRSAMNFNKIEASCALRIIVEERTTGNIIVRAPQSIMPYVSLSVKSSTLHATLLSGAPVSRRSNIVAEVYVPYNTMINEISTSSAARVIVKPTISCNELKLEAKSASAIEISAGVKKASIEASGASNIKAELGADDIDLEFSGASVVDISGQVTNAEIELSGASTLRAAKLRASKLDLECSGASKATTIGIDCTIKSSGASTALVECLGTLNATASGASSIIYSGDCKLNTISNTGGSTIRKK